MMTTKVTWHNNHICKGILIRRITVLLSENGGKIKGEINEIIMGPGKT
jgi:hypothetical protein